MKSLFWTDIWKAWPRKCRLIKDAAHYFSAHFIMLHFMLTKQCQRLKNGATDGLSDDVELAHRRLLSPAVLIEPLPVGRDGEDGAVLAGSPIWLLGDFSLPVFEAHIRA